MMMTRFHIVVNIYFVKCGSYVGWRYARKKHLDSVYAGKKEDRMMMTRLHTVVDTYFVKCGSYVRWR
uniref:Yippee domain-containing protein n=1 Tax=Brassica oleracea var. oleracea TaxID=109376 RepID=A0A0D2ZTR2_BRAOL